jgi:hypothetical protein
MIWQAQIREGGKVIRLHTTAKTLEEATAIFERDNENIISVELNPTGDLIFPNGVPPCTRVQVQEFVDRIQPLYKYGQLSVRLGKKYYKIVQDESSVYGFVDGVGNIYKAASWNAPAKHIRGNIFSEKGGLEALDSQGFVRYLV